MTAMILFASIIGTTGWSGLDLIGEYPAIQGNAISIAIARSEPGNPYHVHHWFRAASENRYSVFTSGFSFLVDKETPGLACDYIDLVPNNDGVIIMGTTSQFGSWTLAMERRTADGAIADPVLPVCEMPNSVVTGMEDSTGTVHVLARSVTGNLTLYLGVDTEPDSPVVLWVDTLQSSNVMPALLVGDRVHIVSNGADYRSEYTQYDLGGNVTIPATDIIQPVEGSYCQTAGIALTVSGDPAIFVNASSNALFIVLDRETGARLIDPVVIDDTPESPSFVERCGSTDTFYLIWKDGYLTIRFRVVDAQGGCLYDPLYAYQVDQSTSYLTHLDVVSDEFGFIYLTTFAYWHPLIPPPPYSMCEPCFGLFTPNLGVGEGLQGSGPMSIRSGDNPFPQGTSLVLSGSGTATSVTVFDVSGRAVRLLEEISPGLYGWDGCDEQGRECPAGVYPVVARGGRFDCSCSLVKL